MVEFQPSKLVAWVRFPSPAPPAVPVPKRLGVALPYLYEYVPLAQLDRATAF